MPCLRYFELLLYFIILSNNYQGREACGVAAIVWPPKKALFQCRRRGTAEIKYIIIYVQYEHTWLKINDTLLAFIILWWSSPALSSLSRLLPAWYQAYPFCRYFIKRFTCIEIFTTADFDIPHCNTLAFRQKLSGLCITSEASAIHVGIKEHCSNDINTKWWRRLYIYWSINGIEYFASWSSIIIDTFWHYYQNNGHCHYSESEIMYLSKSIHGMSTINALFKASLTRPENKEPSFKVSVM